MIRWIAAACLVLTCSTVVRAQTAGISGTVVDETGGGVPGATVQLTGPSGRQLTTSGQSGAYRFAGLGAGAYQVTVSLIGFSQATRDVVVGSADVIAVPAIIRTSPT
jgi:iron complex outermembrane receptor protein